MQTKNFLYCMFGKSSGKSLLEPCIVFNVLKELAFWQSWFKKAN